MISVIRVAILLKVGFNWRVWSIGQSNMAIVAGTAPTSFPQTMELKWVTACLPSLRPLLFFILYGELNPSVRGARRKAFSRAWTRNHSSALVQTHDQGTIASGRRHPFIPLSDEALGFSAIEQAHEVAVASSGDCNAHDHGDIEMQMGVRRTKADPGAKRRGCAIYIEGVRADGGKDGG